MLECPVATRTQTPAERTAEMRKQLPDSPGVYLFKGRRGRVLYVGKASSIRKRFGSHFSKPATRGTYEMLEEIETIDFVATETEAEALLAEQNFIRRHRPPYNIRLRDDKSYPYIGISLDERFPRVYFTRERHRADRAYFGPFSNAKRVRETLDLLGKLFPYRTCDGPEPGRASGSPCLDYGAGRREGEVAEEFTIQYYSTSLSIPAEIVGPPSLAQDEAVHELLAERRDGPVELRHARRGEKRRLYELAERNARLALEQ